MCAVPRTVLLSHALRRSPLAATTSPCVHEATPRIPRSRHTGAPRARPSLLGYAGPRSAPSSYHAGMERRVPSEAGVGIRTSGRRPPAADLSRVNGPASVQTARRPRLHLARRACCAGRVSEPGGLPDDRPEDAPSGSAIQVRGALLIGAAQYGRLPAGRTRRQAGHALQFGDLERDRHASFLLRLVSSASQAAGVAAARGPEVPGPGIRAPEVRVPGVRVPGVRVPGVRVPGVRGTAVRERPASREPPVSRQPLVFREPVPARARCAPTRRRGAAVLRARPMGRRNRRRRPGPRRTPRCGLRATCESPPGRRPPPLVPIPESPRAAPRRAPRIRRTSRRTV